MPVFGFNNAEVDLLFIKSCLLPIFVNGRYVEPTVVQKANQVVSFKFGDNPLFDFVNFLGGVTSLDFFLKAYKSNKTTRLFCEWFYCTEKLGNKKLPPYGFFNFLRNSNAPEKDYSNFEKLVQSGLSRNQPN